MLSLANLPGIIFGYASLYISPFYFFFYIIFCLLEGGFEPTQTSIQPYIFVLLKHDHFSFLPKCINKVLNCDCGHSFVVVFVDTMRSCR